MDIKHFLGAKGIKKPASYIRALEKKDYKAALPLIAEAIRRDDGQAMAFLGAMTAMGLGVEKDSKSACGWFRQAATHGNVASQAALGMCLASGIGIRKDRQEAAYWLYRAGCAGNMKSIEALAALAYQDASVVGEHFSEDQLVDLVLKWKSARAGGEGSG
jgi:TPR repeat protein